ncbi:MAG: sulfurtransferase TusA family protein [Sulfuritalea sp.]|nr:sulfurtransferase TusA family protein [Sulfuritalea sp.]
MSEAATVTLDVCGLPCPAPLLGAKKLIDDLQPGQTLRLISDCPGTADDLSRGQKLPAMSCSAARSWEPARAPT